jgi:hypothetical protein
MAKRQAEQRSQEHPPSGPGLGLEVAAEDYRIIYRPDDIEAVFSRRSH